MAGIKHTIAYVPLKRIHLFGLVLISPYPAFLQLSPKQPFVRTLRISPRSFRESHIKVQYFVTATLPRHLPQLLYFHVSGKQNKTKKRILMKCQLNYGQQMETVSHQTREANFDFKLQWKFKLSLDPYLETFS